MEIIQNSLIECNDICNEVIALSSDTCILSFSVGKDSIATWLKIRPLFKRIVPVYMYIVPGLSFVEKWIKYYEERFGVDVVQVPHPSLYRMLNQGIYQTHYTKPAIYAQKLPNFTYAEVFQAVREDYDADGAYVAVGNRVNDSLIRRAAIKRYGTINKKDKKFYPIAYMKNKEVYDVISEAGLELPIDYQLFGRSYDGLDARFLIPIAKHFPEDYQRMKEYFPCLDHELQRFQYGHFRD